MTDEEIRNIWYSLGRWKKITEQDLIFARAIIKYLLGTK